MELKNLVEQQRETLLKTLQACIQIPSVQEEDGSAYPYGANIQRCLEFMLNTGKELGFKTENLDNQAGWCELGAVSYTHLAVFGPGQAGNGVGGKVQLLF